MADELEIFDQKNTSKISSNPRSLSIVGGAMGNGIELTEVLSHWNEGSKDTLDRLMPWVVGELRARAERYLEHERSDHTLQPTAMVNEVYLRLLERRHAAWQSRAHFFAFASRLMRRILVDHARARDAIKRGSGALTIALDDLDNLTVSPPELDLLALDQALERLARLDPDHAQIVELRYFGGLSIAETAEVLGIGDATVNRRWASARSWLYGQLQESRRESGTG
jgi:RNA polymerase sigma factor (TIGR02999 family)